MRISEVVRGLDLLRSTARQILIARALGARLSNSPIAAADCFRGGV
jgi:glutamyl/glutaminyl-tRNA synthetase